MIVKKANGRAFGAVFNAKEQKAANLEIGRQLAEYTLKHEKEFDAMVLWTLHEEFGFGPERLQRLYTAFGARIKELLKKYELGELDKAWACTERLEEYGIDLDEWKRRFNT